MTSPNTLWFNWKNADIPDQLNYRCDLNNKEEKCRHPGSTSYQCDQFNLCHACWAITKRLTWTKHKEPSLLFSSWFPTWVTPSVDFAWKISKLSLLLLVYATFAVWIGDNVPSSVAKTQFMDTSNACEIVWFLTTKLKKVVSCLYVNMGTCQPWECPDLKRIRSDLILPVVERIAVDIFNGPMKNLFISKVNATKENTIIEGAETAV